MPRAARPRTAELDALSAVDALAGLGPSARAALAAHGIMTVADLLWTAPTGWDDLRSPIPMKEAVLRAREGDVRVVATGIVKSASVVFLRGRRGVRVLVEDAADPSVNVHLFWFFMAHSVLSLAKPGMPVIVVGKLKVGDPSSAPRQPPRMAHPDLFADGPSARVARARYPRLGPSGAALRKAIAYAITSGLAPDPVPWEIGLRESLPAAPALLARAHALGGDLPDTSEQGAFVERLAWAEAFTRIWERLRAEAAEGSSPAPRIPRDEKKLAALGRAFGFELTGEQRAAIDTITADLDATRPMRRLVLGDVGTGKTAVALAAIVCCVAAGKQAAILAPTSVLAEQYLAAITPAVRATGAEVALVVSGPEKKRALAALASGTARIAIGTHALLGDDVALPDLGLVVVDEQQRLGVAQRLALVRKGTRPHLLTLSATPIPRTLSLALRGEIATSTLVERPAGRKDVTTVLAHAGEIDGVTARVREAVRRDERVFWVVPRVFESDDDEEGDAVASAVARRAALARALAGLADVALLHGGMKAEAQRKAMVSFRSGATPVLVATTVVEVGVDVPEATLMVVEDAELFGLSQLHQLRGRVGRGAEPGTCVLLHRAYLDDLARRRLDTLVRFSRGEDVAKRDLELRGAGDLSGTRQHGEVENHWLDAAAAYGWLPRLADDARRIFVSDRDLAKPEHRVLGSMVRRLEHAIAVREEAG